jgi:hypothetical protein
MRSINELRRGLDAETADLVVDIPLEVIRTRVRRVRMRRATRIAVGAALTVAAMVTPVLILGRGTAPQPTVAAPPSASTSESACPTPSAASPLPAGAPLEVGGGLGPFVSTGVTFDAPNLNTQFDVLVGISGTRDTPVFTIGFRNRNTGQTEPWDGTVLARDAQGDLPGRTADGVARRFFSVQLILGPNRVLDVGFYTRAPQRVTVTSENRPTDAEISLNVETGWSLFWAVRDAAPLPPDYNMSQVVYDGPENVTLTAYNAAGNVEYTVTGGVFVGNRVQNPRDNSPTHVPSSPPSAPSC